MGTDERYSWTLHGLRSRARIDRWYWCWAFVEHLRPNALGGNCADPRRHLSCRWTRTQYPVDYRICDGVPCRHPSVGHGPSRVAPLDPCGVPTDAISARQRR